MYYLLTLLSILYAISLTAAAKYPSNLQRCHFGNESCLTTVISSYARMLKDERRDINAVRLDPLHVDKMEIIQNRRSSAVNINLNFTDVSIFGLSNLNVKNVVGFDRDPATSKFEIYANVEKLTLIAKYKARGNVIILRVAGRGPANLTFDNMDLKMEFIPKTEIRKGKQYLQFSDVKLYFTTKHLYMQFDNLFIGRDKVSSDGSNTFLNENWSRILKELRPVLKKAIGKVVKEVANPIFDKFPYDTFFL